MNDTDITRAAEDEVLRIAAAEIHRARPAPRAWESIGEGQVRSVDRRSTPVRRGVLAVAAASVIAVGVAGTIAILDGDDPATVPAASDWLPPVGEEDAPWTPVIEQPVLTDDMDAIPVSNDVDDWVGRALFPARTPDGFTVAFVSHEVGGDVTELGDVDTGDVQVSFITTTPRGTSRDPQIVIETVPSGIEVDDINAETVTIGTGVAWDVSIEQGSGGLYYASAYSRTDGASGMLTLSGMVSETAARSQTVTVLESLRLVRVEKIPTEVVDLNRLPQVATSGPTDAASGFMRAARTTNAWCVVTQIGNGGVTGCGARFDPASTPAIFVEQSFSDQNIVGLAGLAAPEVTSIEIDLTDGTTLTIEPTFPDETDGGTGFWLTSHRHEGTIPSDGPVANTRVIGGDGTVIGTIEDS